MRKSTTKELRKKLDTKIIGLVKPANMSIDEYRIACNLENINPSVEDGQYLHWLITAANVESNWKLAKQVKSTILNALKKKYLLDESDIEQQSYFCDAILDIFLKDKEWVTNLLEATLENYKGTIAFDFCKSLNKAFGFTDIEYFNKLVV